MSQTKSPTQSINAKLILPFMNAVREVFQKMANVSIAVGKPYLKVDAGATYDVCGIIGFSGEIAGAVVVSFSNATAEKLVEAFAGTKFTSADPDFSDAVGELANMIAGSAKQQLEASASISLPSVVIGKGYLVASMSNVPCLVIPCSSALGDFAVEVSIKRNPAE
jgi:chemotaxis protein CheX